MELSVQPRSSYSIQTTSAVAASRPFMLIAAERLMKMITGCVPPVTPSHKERVMPLLLQQRHSKSKMKTISLNHLGLSFGVPPSLSPHRAAYSNSNSDKDSMDARCYSDSDRVAIVNNNNSNINIIVYGNCGTTYRNHSRHGTPCHNFESGRNIMVCWVDINQPDW
jgi:hypothetical protein